MSHQSGRLGPSWSSPAPRLARLARRRLAVRGIRPGELPAGFKPTKVVFAIMLGSGKELTVDTLFPFSQVTLAHAARILRGYGIDVEVIGIPSA